MQRHVVADVDHRGHLARRAPGPCAHAEQEPRAADPTGQHHQLARLHEPILPDRSPGRGTGPLRLHAVTLPDPYSDVSSADATQAPVGGSPARRVTADMRQLAIAAL